MNVFLMTLHVVVCLVLVVVVLLQHGKGADMGAVLGGGGSNTVFGSRGAGNFLTKLTTGCAITFMLTSLTLSYLRSQDSDSQLFEAGYEEPLTEAVGEVEGDADAGGLFEVVEEEEPVDFDVLEEIEPVVPADEGGTEQ
jgi:preprotein translocase subunit SecG